MVPHIATPGHSFKGAGQYYLHDKKAQTKERVMWTETINLPTQDPEKAFGWMAHTSMNANRLKQQAGIPTTGRKNKVGDVYAFSLAWHPKQQPDKDTLLQSALETLGLLKLQDHQAVIVAHNDTEHPHVHVVCNLIHPENGKKAVPSYDRLTLSQWAENLERNDGEILCEQRVINNQKRREQGQDNKLKLIKHKEKPLDIAPLINELYQQSDSGKAFQAAVAEKGFTLAKGDRRGFVLVDEQGKIYNLSRQLEGQRAKDVRERLKDIQELPNAKEISEDRKHFDRDKYETERQKKIVDSAIEAAEQEPKKKVKDSKKLSDTRQVEKDGQDYDDSHLAKLDALREWEQRSDRQRDKLKQQMETFYGRKKLVKEIKTMEEQLSQPKFWDKINPNRIKSLKTYMDNLKKSLSNIDQRIAEQYQALELKIQKDHPDNKNRKRDDLKPSPENKQGRDNSPPKNNDYDLDR